MKFESILPEHEAFIHKQHMFWVGSAPSGSEGHVNLSPKGYDTLRIFSPTEVAYLDLTGSGNETSAHLLENGRITLMFMSFEGAPSILRLYGKGRVILPDTEEWRAKIDQYDVLPGARQMIAVHIHAVSTSCGFSVPIYEYKGERDRLIQWADKMGEERLQTYRQHHNMQSIDGMATHLGQQTEG
ncbi:hypothetical protein J2Z66_008198 [Paenibacillus eucommiae]|uniref:Pyridoxamine 5'-phosphate oxidase N-terminal domain-containing protein n=1 Tax=Paenibacillus eucommiae TaxID=1355755 RepID=A0ABS4JBF2_9BACL|nr:hypothetical protein [Paenibacillus eucommiae]